jgi:hypothetical protein
MNFVLLNEGKISDAAHGGHLTPAILGKIAAASTTYLNQYVAAYWGGIGTHGVRAGASKTDVHAGEIVCAIVDALPDAPDAVAYHDVAGKAVPVVFLARIQCNSLLSGPDSVSSALTHELAVSDFVLPAFFAPGSAAPWNYLGSKSADTALKSALATAPGGYQIRSGAGGHEVQVQGMIPESHLARKRNWSSRTYRRGVRL